jgi:T5SS/PEP-CTERM-associated repeat protein
MVTVDGANSKWINSGGLSLGRGEIQVTSGGQVASDIGFIASASGAPALFQVSGVGSAYNLSGNLYIGGFIAEGTGTLMVSSGGAVSVSNGDLTVGGTTAVGIGTLVVASGGTVSVPDGLVSVTLQGTIKGDGVISAAIINSGVVAPGTSAGALHVNGDLIQGALGKLQFELGGTTPGTSYDQLIISGLASLAGTLEVTTIDMFTPQAGNSFNILDWGNRSGTFATLGLPPLAPGLIWDTSQLYTAGVLSVVVSLPGDYNLNGTVDAADYVVWRKNDGPPTGYITWRDNFGRTAGSGSGVTVYATIPEPATAVALMFAAVGWSLSRRRGG